MKKKLSKNPLFKTNLQIIFEKLVKILEFQTLISLKRLDNVRMGIPGRPYLFTHKTINLNNIYSEKAREIFNNNFDDLHWKIEKKKDNNFEYFIISLVYRNLKNTKYTLKNEEYYEFVLGILNKKMGISSPIREIVGGKSWDDADYSEFYYIYYSINKYNKTIQDEVKNFFKYESIKTTIDNEVVRTLRVKDFNFDVASIWPNSEKSNTFKIQVIHSIVNFTNYYYFNFNNVGQDQIFNKINESPFISGLK